MTTSLLRFGYDLRVAISVGTQLVAGGLEDVKAGWHLQTPSLTRGVPVNLFTRHFFFFDRAVKSVPPDF